MKQVSNRRLTALALAGVPVVGLAFVMAMLIAPGAWAQSIQTDGNIETDGQLVSKATSGPPLEVSSGVKVENLNADTLDGLDSFFFAFFSEFQANQAAIAAHHPDPPCFNNTHRFADCGNGTVTDGVTSLIWLKDAGCLPVQNYAAANATAATLFDGSTIDPSGGDCGLTDGSKVGDWRLPTKEEWEGIVDSSCTTDPEIVGNQSPTPGCYTDAVDPDSEWASGVVSSFYWSASTFVSFPSFAWDVDLLFGSVGFDGKAGFSYVWPVRGGQ